MQRLRIVGVPFVYSSSKRVAQTCSSANPVGLHGREEVSPRFSAGTTDQLSSSSHDALLLGRAD
jgi:hypothetical protein